MLDRPEARDSRRDGRVSPSRRGVCQTVKETTWQRRRFEPRKARGVTAMNGPKVAKYLCRFR